MSQPIQDPRARKSVTPKPDFSFTVDETIGLARRLRGLQADGRSYINLDFQGILRSSGRWLFVNDFISLLLAFFIGGFVAWSYHMLLDDQFQSLMTSQTLRQFIIFGSFGMMGLFWLDSGGHYHQRLPYWETMGNILTVTVFGVIASGFAQFAMKDDSSRLWMVLNWMFFFLFVVGGRSIVRRHLDHKHAWKIPALIIGEGPMAEKARRALRGDKQMGFSLVGQISSMQLEDMVKPEAWKHLLVDHDACHVFLALDGGEIERHQAALKAMTRARVPCSIVPPWMGLPSSTLSPHHFMMQDVMLLHDTNKLQLPLPCFLKRLFDVTVSSVALALLSPVFLAVMIGVRRDGGPAFFMQPRVGKNGRLFNCYKFRSMRVDAEAVLQKYLTENPEAAVEWKQFQKLKQDVRITRFGDFIRRTSMDELPQLLNVLKGDMSLVGPRPCMIGQEPLYEEDFSFYMSVRPGITGPWQVSGRNELTFKERVSLEAWYVRNWNLWMDIVIMLKTVPAVLNRGAY